MKIYIVQGSTGEYSDHMEWPVRAFDSERKAQDFVNKLSEEYRFLKQKYGHHGFSWYCHIEEENMTDPNMRSDYTGTNYSYFEIELELNEDLYLL